MPRYSVTYLKFSDVSNNFVLVEDVVEADFVETYDGALAFSKIDGDRNKPVMLLPPGCWKEVVIAADTSIIQS